MAEADIIARISQAENSIKIGASYSLATAQQAVADSQSGVISKIENGLNQTLSKIIDAQVNIQSSVQGSQDFLENTVSYVRNQLTSEIRAVDLGLDIADLWEGMVKWLTIYVPVWFWPQRIPLVRSVVTMIADGWEQLWKRAEKRLAPEVSLLTSYLAAARNLPEPIAEQFLQAGSGSAPVSLLTQAATVASVPFTYMGQVAPALFKEAVTTFERELLGSRLSPVEAAASARRGFVSFEEAAKEAADSGLAPERFAKLFQLTRPMLSPTEILEFSLRLTEGTEFASEYLVQLGYEPLDAEALKLLAFKLPPPADLIHMMVREAFSPDIAGAFGQYEGYPEEADRLFAQQGINPDWARRYWAAHWGLPSPQMGYEMFHRGIIDKGELILLLKALDIMPFWRDKLIDLSYNVLTRVDVRRMHKLKVLDRSGVVKAYKDLGYNDKDAEGLATFTERLNANELEDLAASIRTPVANAIIAAYVDGIIDDGQLTTRLATLGYKENKLNALTARARMGRTNMLGDQARNAVKSAYIGGFLKKEAAIEALGRYGHNGDAASRIIAAWEPARELRDWREDIGKEKDLTKADILAAFKEGIISATSAGSQLEEIGYSPGEARTLTSLAEKQLAKQNLDEQIAAIKAEYMVALPDDRSALGKLGSLNLPAAKMDALQRRWEADKKAAYSPLPLAYLDKLANLPNADRGFIEGELARGGYSPPQINAILALFFPPEPPA